MSSVGHYQSFDVAAERPSYSYENKKYLLQIMMNQLGITDDDLEKDPSWIKAKVRELRLDSLLQK